MTMPGFKFDSEYITCRAFRDTVIRERVAATAGCYSCKAARINHHHRTLAGVLHKGPVKLQQLLKEAYFVIAIDENGDKVKTKVGEIEKGVLDEQVVEDATPDMILEAMRKLPLNDTLFKNQSVCSWFAVLEQIMKLIINASNCDDDGDEFDHDAVYSLALFF